MRYFGAEAAQWRRIGQCASLPQQEIREIDGANTFYLNTHHVICVAASQVPEGEKQVYDTALEGIIQIREGLPSNYTLPEEYAFVEDIYQKMDVLAPSLERHAKSEWDLYRQAYTKYLEQLELESQTLEGLSEADLEKIKSSQAGLVNTFQLSTFENPYFLLSITFGLLAIGGVLVYRRQRGL